MAGFELRFQPLMQFESKPEAGGGTTVVLGADLGETRVYLAANHYSHEGHERMDHAGTVVVARHEEDTEIIHATIPEKRKDNQPGHERAMAVLAFAMFSEDPRNGAWEGSERLFVDPSNEQAVDSAYLSMLGVHARRVRRLQRGEMQSEDVHIAQPTERVAGRIQSKIRYAQMYPAPLPEGYEGVGVWLDAENKDVA